MIKDITLGQYFPGDSAIHKIDPRFKILISILFIAAAFAANSALSFALLVLCVICAVLISRISLLTILKGLKPILFIMLFTTVFQLFFTKSGKLLVEWYFIKIYSDGIVYAVKMILRIVVLIISSSLFLTYTTSPIVLTNGIEGLLKPLSKMGVKVHIFALMMSIALRFIPTLTEETDKIMSAQRARGTSFTSGSLKKRAGALISVFVPLLFSAIHRAYELADAMICRGYRGGENRTRLYEMKAKFSDFVWLILCACALVGVILLNNISLSGIFNFTVFS